MSSFDTLAGLSEMETRRARQDAERRQAALDAAKAEYAQTGKVPEGFRMVYGHLAAKPFETPANPAAMATAAKATFDQPKKGLMPTAAEISSPRGVGAKKAFFRNLKNGHIKKDELAPEFLDALKPQDRAAVDSILQGSEPKAGVTVSDTSFDHLAGITEWAGAARVVGAAVSFAKSPIGRAVGKAALGWAAKKLMQKRREMKRQEQAKKVVRKRHESFSAPAEIEGDSMSRFDEMCGLAEVKGHPSVPPDEAAKNKAWLKKYNADQPSGREGWGSNKVQLKPDEKMVFGKVRKVAKGGKAKLSAIIKDVNDKNAPPGGWTDADRVK
jgi:hypothetical protein